MTKLDRQCYVSISLTGDDDDDDDDDDGRYAFLSQLT